MQGVESASSLRRLVPAPPFFPKHIGINLCMCLFALGLSSAEVASLTAGIDEPALALQEVEQFVLRALTRFLTAFECTEALDVDIPDRAL